MKWYQFLAPALALSGLCAGWVLVQLLARKVGTKNHLDSRPGCGNCHCYDGVCEREAVLPPEARDA